MLFFMKRYESNERQKERTKLLRWKLGGRAALERRAARQLIAAEAQAGAQEAAPSHKGSGRCNANQEAEETMRHVRYAPTSQH